MTSSAKITKRHRQRPAIREEVGIVMNRSWKKARASLRKCEGPAYTWAHVTATAENARARKARGSARKTPGQALLFRTERGAAGPRAVTPAGSGRHPTVAARLWGSRKGLEEQDPLANGRAGGALRIGGALAPSNARFLL